MWRQKGKFLETKFIMPNAPQIPITVNMGMRMPGWYDIVRPKNRNVRYITYSDLHYSRRFCNIG